MVAVLGVNQCGTDVIQKCTNMSNMAVNLLYYRGVEPPQESTGYTRRSYEVNQDSRYS